MGFYISWQTRQYVLDRILYIMVDESVGLGRILLGQIRQCVLVENLRIIRKENGFCWHSTYYYGILLIMMGFYELVQTRQ